MQWMTITRSEPPEIRDQRSEIRDQRSEIRDQRPRLTRDPLLELLADCAEAVEGRGEEGWPAGLWIFSSGKVEESRRNWECDRKERMI